MRSLLAMLTLVAACSADLPQADLGAAERAESSAQALESVGSALSRSAGDLEPRTRSDGLRELKLVRGFRHATMVVRDKDGSRRIHCVDDADEAAQLLRSRHE